MLIGPIFTRELVTAPRRSQHFVYRGVYGGALLVAISTAFLVFYGTQISYTISDTARFASILFYILAPLQLALITFLAFRAGDNWDLVQQYLVRSGKVAGGIAIGIVVIGAGIWLWNRQTKKRE